jgi:signal transduction histidine kinase
MFTTKQAGRHLGLGLYYAKKVVDMHGGRFILAAHSQEGLEAKIILPKKRVA